MNLQVEVLKTDLPSSATSISCQIEALGSDEAIRHSASLTQDRAKLPGLNFSFSKASSHVALTFIASSQGGKEEVGSCLYPITFNYHVTRLLGQLIPHKLFKKTHLVHLSTRVAGLVDKMVGKIWFRIKDLTVPSMVHNVGVDGNWLDMRSVQQPHDAELVLPKPNVGELVSREAQGLCTAPVPGDTAVMSVLFHSVTMQSSVQAPDDSLTIACMGSDPGMKEDALFDDGGGSLQTTPTLNPITLKCGRNDTVLELHAVDSSRNGELLFSSSCPLSLLVRNPFQHYNWEYNWRWVPGVGGFSPEHSQGNLEANVTVSVVYWPPRSDRLQHEGLEVFIKEVEFESQQEKTDLVLTCQLHGAMDSAAMGGVDTPPYRERKDSIADDEDCDLSATVIEYSSNDREFSGASGYYFFSSDPNFTSSSSGHRIVLTLYATSHNTSLWWHTEAKSTVTVELPEDLRRALSWPKNEKGVRLEISGDAISNGSGNTLEVNRLAGILRWKKTDAEFLGLDTIAHLSTLPSLSEISVTGLDRFTSGSPEILNSELPGYDAWKSAVAKMGREILRLQEENAVLKAENRDYEKFVLDKESSIIVTAANQKALLPFTKNDLIQKIVELSECLRTETEARKIFQSKVHKLKKTLLKKNDIEAHYTELQRAHESQQMLVRELQEKVTKYKKCWETCKQQDLIIEQLLAREGSAALITPAATRENSKHIDTAREPQGITDLKTRGKGSAMQNKHSGTKDELESFREELSRARSTFHELEEKVAQLSDHQNPSTSHHEENRIASLEAQVEIASVRERALMEEMRTNITRWAKEKSRYETEIAQMQGRRSSHSQTPVRITDTSAGRISDRSDAESIATPRASEASSVRARHSGSSNLLLSSNAAPTGASARNSTTNTSGTGDVPASTRSRPSQPGRHSIAATHGPNGASARNSTTGDVLSSNPVSTRSRPSQQPGRRSIAATRGSDASTRPLPTPLSTAQRHSLSNTAGDHSLSSTRS